MSCTQLFLSRKPDLWHRTSRLSQEAGKGTPSISQRQGAISRQPIEVTSKDHIALSGSIKRSQRLQYDNLVNPPLYTEHSTILAWNVSSPAARYHYLRLCMQRDGGQEERTVLHCIKRCSVMGWFHPQGLSRWLVTKRQLLSPKDRVTSCRPRPGTQTTLSGDTICLAFMVALKRTHPMSKNHSSKDKGRRGCIRRPPMQLPGKRCRQAGCAPVTASLR